MKAFLGLDVSKGYCDFALINDQKALLEEPFQLDDNHQGHQTLSQLIAGFIQKHGITELCCAVESTGGFENNWYALLIGLSNKLSVKVARLNPSGVKTNALAQLRRNITDALSAFYIADYLVSHPKKVVYDRPDNLYSSFRGLYRQIQLLKKQSNQLVNSLKMALYSSFPEALSFCSQGFPDYMLELLGKYPTAQQIAVLTPAELALIKGITLTKAGAIIEKAKKTTGSRADHVQAYNIRSMAKQISRLQSDIEDHKVFLTEQAKGEEVELLVSIKGIGRYSAVALMIEIEDVSRFTKPRHLASYFGLHPVIKESGDKKSGARLSKQGRSAVRDVLYMCAMSAVGSDDHMKAIYHNHRCRGKSHKASLCVLMHKMLRVVWGVLSTKRPYDAKIDKKNQEQKKPEPKANEKQGREWERKRRFAGEVADEAPISRVQLKKRKAQQQSQAELVGQERDQAPAP